MVKYYKTPDVIICDEYGNTYCNNGIIIIDTDILDEESNRLAMFLINNLHYIKCSKVEAENRTVATPSGIVDYYITTVIDRPRSIREPRLHVFDINDGEMIIDTDSDPALLGELLYNK